MNVVFLWWFCRMLLSQSDGRCCWDVSIRFHKSICHNRLTLDVCWLWCWDCLFSPSIFLMLHNPSLVGNMRNLRFCCWSLMSCCMMLSHCCIDVGWNNSRRCGSMRRLVFLCLIIYRCWWIPWTLQMLRRSRCNSDRCILNCNTLTHRRPGLLRLLYLWIYGIKWYHSMGWVENGETDSEEVVCVLKL